MKWVRLLQWFGVATNAYAHQVFGVDICPHMKQDDTPENFEAQASQSPPVQTRQEHVELQSIVLHRSAVLHMHR